MSIWWWIALWILLSVPLALLVARLNGWWR